MFKKIACLTAALLFGLASQGLASTWVTDQINIDHGDGDNPVMDTTPHLWDDGTKTWDETALIDGDEIEWTYATTGGMDPSQIARHEFHLVNYTSKAWTGLRVTLLDDAPYDAKFLLDGFTATIPGSTAYLSANDTIVEFYFNNSLTIANGAAMTAMVSMQNVDESFYSLLLRPLDTAAPVPLPGAVWLIGSGLAGLAGLRRKMQ